MSFIEWLLGDLEYRKISNNYVTCKRFNETEDKIIVKVAGSHLFETQYGYGLILDARHLVFLKSWQVNSNYYGNEVLLSKKYFNVKESTKEFDEFFEDEEALKWEYWLESAKMQENYQEKDEDGDVVYKNKVKWRL